MKKYIKIVALSTLTFLTLSSCGEDYLEKYPSKKISSDQFAKAVKDRPFLLKANLRGIYKLMFEIYTGGTTSHDDFGQKGYDIFSDILSQDMALSLNTYSRYLNLSDFSATQNFAALKNYMAWRYYYKIINATNIILDASVKEDGTYPQDEESKASLGQTFALRGQAYFMLLNLYSRELDSAEKVLPIYTKSSIKAEAPRPSSEVLDFVIKDLEQAVNLLPNFTRVYKNEVNIDVAQVLLAYAYGAKGENQKAYEQVKAVIERGGYPILSKNLVAYNKVTRTGNGFNDINSTNWIWGQDITLADGLDLVSWWGQMDWFTYSYAAAGDHKSIDEGLYNKIRNDDVRKGWFSLEDKSYLMPLNKFYAPKREYFGQRSITTDYVYMRVEEVYLLAAEFAQKIGKENEAKKYLKAVLSEREDNIAYINTLSGEDLLQEILLQTRIEMWGEGKSYLLMKRNKTTVTRGANHLSFVGESYKYNDPKLTLPVPRSEVENNPYYK